MAVESCAAGDGSITVEDKVVIVQSAFTRNVMFAIIRGTVDPETTEDISAFCEWNER